MIAGLKSVGDETEQKRDVRLKGFKLRQMC